MIDIYQEYHMYLKLEKALSENTIAAYEADLQKLRDYLKDAHILAEKAETAHLRDFIIDISDAGVHARSQARIISGIKSFYHFLIYKKKLSLCKSVHYL